MSELYSHSPDDDDGHLGDPDARKLANRACVRENACISVSCADSEL